MTGLPSSLRRDKRCVEVVILPTSATGESQEYNSCCNVILLYGKTRSRSTENANSITSCWLVGSITVDLTTAAESYWLGSPHVCVIPAEKLKLELDMRLSTAILFDS